MTPETEKIVEKYYYILSTRFKSADFETDKICRTPPYQAAIRCAIEETESKKSLIYKLNNAACISDNEMLHYIEKEDAIINDLKNELA